MQGGNVSVNVDAKYIIYNDILGQVSELLSTLKLQGKAESLRIIDTYIEKYSLTKENREGYLELRECYNSNPIDPLMLYTLICYSFNNQIRFNSKGGYNTPFGRDRGFNPILRDRFIAFVERLREIDIQFHSKDFREMKVEELGENDFVYCDPPYLITVASYNENGGWNEQAERDLLSMLDKVDRAGVRFALSNVLESKGAQNEILAEWAKKYKIHYLDHSYSNCSYQKKDKTSKNVEVLIVNY